MGSPLNDKKVVSVFVTFSCAASARGDFATGQATKFTDSRNERRLRDFAVEGLQEVRKIVHDLKPEQMDKKQLDIALEEFFHEVQVNSGIDIQF